MPLRRKSIKSPTETGSSPHDEYSLICYCGKEVSGRRTETPQIVKCSHCSESLYVLPRDRYPRPHILAVQTLDENKAAEISIATPRPLNVQEVDDNRRLAEPEDNTPPRIWIDETRGARVRKRLALVAGTTMIILLIAVWGLSNRQSRSEKELVLLQESEAVWEYVTLNEWEDAEASAKLALQAAEDLGRTDDDSISLRNLHQELMILNQLSSYSPIEIIQDQPRESADFENWGDLFRARHGGRWLLMQGAIVRQSTPDETRYWFDYPIDLPTSDVDLVWDRPVEWFEELPWEGDRSSVFLAVQMTGVRLIDHQDNSWEILLSSDNVKLWRTPELLSEMFEIDLGLEANQELSMILNSQRVTTPRETQNQTRTDQTDNNEIEDKVRVP